MDKFLQDGPRAKTPRSGPSSSEEKDIMKLQRQILTLVTQLALKLDLDVRELRAAVITTVICKKELAPIDAGQTEMNKYEERIKELKAQSEDTSSAGHKQIMLWCRIINAIAADEQYQAPKEALAAVRAHHAAIESPDQLIGQVFLCKFRKAFDKHSVKLHMVVSLELKPVLRAVVTCLVAIGGKEKQGQEASGSLARELQTKVDKLKELFE